MEENMNPQASEATSQAGAGARVLREIIRTPAFLQIIKVNASDLDPESARGAVRTFLREDPELSLSMMGTVPEVVNYLVAVVIELGRQVNKFPGGLLEQYVSQIASEIDVAALREVPGAFAPLLETVNFKEEAAAALGRMVNAVTGMVNRAEARNPYFLRDAVSGVDWREVCRAALAVTRSAARCTVASVSRLFARQ